MQTRPPYDPQRGFRLNKFGAAILAAGFFGLLIDAFKPKRQRNVWHMLLSIIIFGWCSFAGLAGLALVIGYAVMHPLTAFCIAIIPILDLSYYLYKRHVFGNFLQKVVTSLILGSLLGTLVTGLVTGTIFATMRYLGLN
jgi:hypothetical protein